MLKVYYKVVVSFFFCWDCSGIICDVIDYFEGEKKSVYFVKWLLV